MLAATAAADPKVCIQPPHSRTPRVLGIMLDGKNVLAPRPGSEFPAVSEDGSRIVDLFEDPDELTHSYIQTLVVWSRTGARVAKITTTRGVTDGDTPSPPPDAATRKAGRDADQALAGRRWRPLDRYLACDNDRTTIDLPDGLKIALDIDKQTVTIAASRVVKVLSAPGSRMGEGMSGPCGRFDGLSSAYGGKALGLVIVAPVAQLGGDTCFGGSGVSTVLAIPVH
ncbi:MAG TPA: hypothetical protein VGO00_15420 [Kofleriaceae bacterium]|nr:hypothetical protein [Kofleriaceae bacterium]